MDKFQALQREKKYFRENRGRHGGAFPDFHTEIHVYY